MTTIGVLPSVAWVAWLLLLLTTGAGFCGVLMAAFERRFRVLALLGLVPVAIVLGAAAFQVLPRAPAGLLQVPVGLGLTIIAVLGGGSVTELVLARAAGSGSREGAHGGIMIDRAENGADAGTDASHPPREILRGGATIGYLERVALLGCVLLGQVGGVAIIVAVKGLGRFNELVTEQARERFIIGTLASLIWAGAATAAVSFIR